jgi:SAM-dependent methyltransferase
MDRIAWLKKMRRDCEKQYDVKWASFYGEKWGLYDNSTHQQYLRELLGLIPAGSMILDAACGAGRYEPFLLEKGCSVVAIDQSQGMLDNARVKFPGVSYERVGLQEMVYRDVFDAIICMDAMENVCPEDWPLVLQNFHRALKGEGLLYFTAETLEFADEDEVRQAFEDAGRSGLPLVYGECIDEEVYHYFPPARQVMEWTRQAGFEILQEGRGSLWYHHVLARRLPVPGVSFLDHPF